MTEHVTARTVIGLLAFALNPLRSISCVQMRERTTAFLVDHYRVLVRLTVVHRMSHSAKAHGEAQYDRHRERHKSSRCGAKPDPAEMTIGYHVFGIRGGT
jgi:hypothetical protein